MENRGKGMNTSTQNAQILSYLKDGKAITGLAASKMFGVGHLPRRILDLKERGHNIHSKFIKVKKSNGDAARVKEYWLAEGYGG